MSELFKSLSESTGLTTAQLNTIYKKYLKLISSKAESIYKKIMSEKEKEPNDIFYNRGDYCFYLRYLGKYYINYKAYKRARNGKVKNKEDKKD